MTLKESIQEYIINAPESDKVIKDKTIKSELSYIFPNIGNRNKDLKIKLNLVLYDLQNIPKCVCGNPLEFVSKDKASIYISKFGGWREFCSRICMQKSSDIVKKRQNTNIERYGEISYAKTQEFKDSFSSPWSEEKKFIFNEKSKDTSTLKYGVDHYSKTKEYLESRTNTCIEKYGVTNTFLLKDRVTSGQMEVFGGNVSWLQTDIGKDYMRNNNPMYDSITKEKSRFNRYNKTWDYIDDDFRNAIINKDKDLFTSIMDREFESCNKERIVMAESLNVSYSTLCRYIRDFDVQDRYISPRGAPSVAEREIYDFVKSIFSDTKQSDRTILGNRQEIDIFVPSKNFGIEYDSLYYHSEYSGLKGSNYHLNKTDICESKGIHLLHIFEPEWSDTIKKQIVKSIIKNKLGISENRIFARKCVVVDLDSGEASEFLNANHLSGFKGAKFHKGLIYNNELVSVMSIGEDRYSKNDQYEIARFASKLNTNIAGGMTKLFKSFSLDKPVISYADRRYSSVLNSSYSELFNSHTISGPGWYGFHKSEYILNHRLSYSRSKLKLLPDYDENISSFDNMIKHGYDRIWDCGNIKFYNIRK